VVLQAQDHLPTEGKLISEGEIIRSSVCCEFGGACISHAAGAGLGGRCGAAGGGEAQPLTAIVNSAAQVIVLIERMAQLLGTLKIDRIAGGQLLTADSGRFAQVSNLTLYVVAFAARGVELIAHLVKCKPDQQPGQEKKKDEA
jgi:hypothetical protein